MDKMNQKLTIEPAQDRQARRTRTGIPRYDPLLLSILGSAVLLSLLVIGIAAYWGTGPVLAEIPWYIPLISSFVALTSLSIAYLAYGRYHALRDTLSFWVGSGFAAYGIGQIFYALDWPGLLPSGRPILGNLPGTSAIIVLVDLTILNIFLILAVWMRWPATQSFPGKQWLWPVVGWILFATFLFILLVAYEQFLPVLVDPRGSFTAGLRVWVVILLFFYGAGCVLSVRHYQRTSDRLAGYIAFPQIALVFICIMALIGGKRYDLWWYTQRVVLVSGYLVVLFGLLSEYIRLLQRESEGRHMLNVILKNIPTGLAVTGGPPDFPIKQVSQYALELNQRDPHKLIGMTSAEHQLAWKIFLPDGVTQPSPDQLPIFRASRYGEVVRNSEFIMEAQDGKKIPVLVNAAPIRDAQGNIVAAINSWVDISDRKRAEEILRESETLYRTIARSIPGGGVFVIDRNLRYLIAEGTVIEKLGYTRDQFEGHTIYDVFDAATAAKMEARLRRVFAGETISFQTEQSGRIYWTQHALLDEPLGRAILITLDITDHKQTEMALSESDQRHRAIINQATAGIVRADLNGSYTFVNQAFCDMLGLAESDLLGKTIWQFTYEDDVARNRRFYNRLVEKGIPYETENRFVRQDGSVFWANVSASAIVDMVGRTQSAVFVVVDIQERKQAEERLQQLNLQLESRVEERTAELKSTLGELLESRQRLQVLSKRLVEVQEQERHAISQELHDRVGQNLTALNLNLTIIENQLKGQASTAISTRLTDSMNLVTDMISIVRDVMSDLRPVVLNEYGLMAALQEYTSNIKSRYGLQLEFTKSSALPQKLDAALEMTVLRITQEALLNIVRHAESNQVRVSLGCENEALVLRIEDNGVGFESSADGKITHGHGLVIMRERAEAVGGTLNVESNPGKGTRIEAELPIHNKNMMKKEDKTE